MEAEAAARPEEEVCGLLSGHGNVADTLLPVENALHSPHAFDMEPAGLLDAMRNIRESGGELVAIYHSHPFGPAYPSRTDVASNQYPEVAHVLIGREGAEWRVRAFRLDDGVGELTLKTVAG
ncbi:M67 family metallopeptidase [Thiohalorhabdus sp. Cl-TMA]|uniref:M67 family metallopeptidase n=2 Tax=Thiohalorhabdus methylotrophus TaxID=3242694 RepID=A0ABV4TS37_9GAMM